MPQVIENKLKSLSQICVDRISDNMEKLCKIWTCKQSGYVFGPELNNNPFELLPIVKLEEIIKNLSTKDRIKKEVFHFLIVPQLRDLDLNCLEDKDESSGLLNLASVKCHHLKKLSLSRHQISEDFITYLPTFEKLQVLDIPYSAVGDCCLQIIGTSCKELKELNISHCSAVTDLGIEGLCVRVNHSGRKNEKRGECQSICKLSTAGTQITKQGVQLALSNLPCLKVWNEVSVQLLYNIHYIDFFTKNLEDIPKYSLINICVSDWRYDPLNTPYIRESLNLIVSICPYIMEMKIMAVNGLKDSDLQSLLSLERLSELHISEFETECEITFKDGIAPILKGIGGSLKTLSLSRIRGINIQVIMEHCTGLRSLTLKFHSDCGTFWKEEDTTTKEDKKRIKLDQRVLWQLEKLSLFTGSNGSFYNCPIGSNNLMSLLVTPTLRYISIHDCTTLTDSILEEAEKFHNFRILEYLELYGCHSVTDDGIDLLMNNNNALEHIVLHHCKLLTQDAVDCWKDEINANNWFVSIDYWNFEPAPENNSSSSHSSECEYGDYYYDN